MSVATDKGSESGKITKRRRKAIKSCTFCRKRKLKCDQRKPMCKQCSDRKLPNCMYTDDFNYEISTDELFSDTPNVELIQRIKELESMLESSSHTHEESGNNCPTVITPQSISTAASMASSSTGSNTARNSISNKIINNPICGGVSPNGVVTSITDSGFKLDSNPDSKNNPLWDYRILNKLDGQNIIFGPTSWRTTVAAQGKRFIAEYKKLWEMIKPERDRWMTQNSDPNFCNPPLKLLLRSNEPDGLIQSVCKTLPPFSKIKQDIDIFFDSNLHDLLRIVDKDKVLKDLRECFIVSKTPLAELDEQVIDLIAPQNDGNFYKVAVILLMVCIVEHNGFIQGSISRFLLSLNALNTASRLNFVERLQFLLLRFFNKIYCSYDCCEASQIAALAAEICDCSLTLGFSNADWWYKDQESIVGPAATLRNMWYWALYTDVVVSFEMGKPLLISDDHFDPEKTFSLDYSSTPVSKNSASVNTGTSTLKAIEDEVERRRRNLLMEFLRISRKCMTEINCRTSSGNVQNAIDSLMNYVETKFLPIKFYTMKEKFKLVDIFDIVVLSPSLGMLLNFHNIQRMCFKSTSFQVKNRLVKFGLISLSLCVNLVLFAYEQEKDNSNEQLNLALFLINPLLLRVLSEMYALFFYRVSLFERGVIMLCDTGVMDISLNDFEIPQDNYYSFNATILKFRETIDQLFVMSNDLQKKIGQSYQLTTALALERVSRTLFDKGLESRTMTENSCGLNDEDFISEEVLNHMTDIFWSNYEQQSQDLWQMKPQDFYTDLTSNDFDLDLK